MHKHLFACIRNWNCFDKYKGPSIKKHIFEINRIVILFIVHALNDKYAYTLSPYPNTST